MLSERYQLRKNGRLSSSILFADLAEVMEFLRDASEIRPDPLPDYEIVEIKSLQLLARIKDRFAFNGQTMAIIEFIVDGQSHENYYTF